MKWEEVILGRRSIGKVKPDPVPKELIETMLAAAVRAPNHHLTEPWRFWVMTGEGRGVLGKALADIADEAMGEVPAEEREALRLKSEEKAYRAPVVIAAAAELTRGGRAVQAEDLAAVHAAVQNLLLTAHALGLGAVWRTGAPAYHPLMKRAFGLRDEDEVVGFIYIGYPDMTPPPQKRKPFQEKTTWLE